MNIGNNYYSFSVFDEFRLINFIERQDTPSYVSFTEKQILFSYSARLQRDKNDVNTIFDINKLIGRKFSDPIIQNNIKLWPFKIEVDEHDNPLICVNDQGQIKKYHAEEIYSFLLSEINKVCSYYLHTSQGILNAVISVPINFTDSQKQAIKNAGKIIGLNILSIVDEPTAAIIAYKYNNKFDGDQNILIFDQGGNKLDISLLFTHNDIIEVKATVTNEHIS
ncbi:hypothetical protein ABPG72_020732 [Tetrahymena utriculariae]